MPWKRRKHGSSRQRGKAFYTADDPKLLLARMRRSVQRANLRDKKGLLKRLNREHYDKLGLWEQTDKKKLAEGEYRFLITNGSMSHIAFRTQAGLDKWLRDTGVKIGAKGWGSNYPIKGSYTIISMSGNKEKLDAFGREHHLLPSSILDNGEYTRAYIQEGKHGNTIYHLNCNYPREVLPYKHE
jgi:hypothetical protein